MYSFARCLILSSDLVSLQACLVLTLGTAFQTFNLAVPELGKAKLGFLVFEGVPLHLQTTFVSYGNSLFLLSAWWGEDGFV